MPTPYGSRGGMAFSADELRVLRRALAIALKPHPAPGEVLDHPGPLRAAEARDCLRLAEALNEAVREGGRLHAFLLADLARYRAALPGSARGYAERLLDALAAGCRPGPEDVDALRSLCDAPCGTPEAIRRRALLRRCEHLALGGAHPPVPEARNSGAVVRTTAAFLGPWKPEQAAAGTDPKTAPKPGGGTAPQDKPPATQPKSPRPDRPIPTPGEVFPPRRKPVPPPTAAVRARVPGGRPA
ncbi:hypothetical protein FHS39_003411 [Streptomyces olivoverticillatus]|uniref:Uncharacterized protein n=1 Tax=Streptomyces olivoverticillatus TaxID=66427 RepID=A0A7W7PLL1_9ACTN|nr:hypothetical protein [Streptomyces olivoverticillatus]MBB4894377.1 hypothetical protein [Streptomyces olivoverticillatus]